MNIETWNISFSLATNVFEYLRFVPASPFSHAYFCHCTLDIFVAAYNIFCHCENPINCELVIMGVKMILSDRNKKKK